MTNSEYWVEIGENEQEIEREVEIQSENRSVDDLLESFRELNEMSLSAEQRDILEVEESIRKASETVEHYQPRESSTELIKQSYLPQGIKWIRFLSLAEQENPNKDIL